MACNGARTNRASNVHRRLVPAKNCNSSVVENGLPEVLQQHQVGIRVIDLGPCDPAAIAGNRKSRPARIHSLLDRADLGQFAFCETEELKSDGSSALWPPGGQGNRLHFEPHSNMPAEWIREPASLCRRRSANSIALCAVLAVFAHSANPKRFKQPFMCRTQPVNP